MIEKLNKFIEEHIVMDELDGVERTLVEFNFNDWIRFKRENLEKEEAEIAPIHTKKGIEQRDKAREKMLKKAEKEEKLKNSVQRIKPIIIEPKIKRMAETPPGKRFRRTKAEMKAENKPEKLKGWAKYHADKKKKTKQQKYPDEMAGFVERHMNTNSNKQLCDLINEKYDVGIIPQRLAPYMNYKKLKRNKNLGEKKKLDNPKKLGKPKIYTDEAVQFLKDNINNFSNKELCEELNSQFNIKATASSLQNMLCHKGIKRDRQIDVDPELMKLINKSKEKDVLILRDYIIEKLEKDIPINKLRGLMDKRKGNLPGESVEDEVRRIKEKRDSLDQDVDELELG